MSVAPLPPLLSVRGLSAAYGPVRCLHGIDLDIAAGEITALVGANGAGKTTLLRCLSGVTENSTSGFMFCGEDISKTDASYRVHLGLAHVPEGRQIWPAMSVHDNLTLGAFLRKDASRIKKDLQDILALFPILHEKAFAMAGTLSGGQQQMLAIGRALMSKPKLLLLDEPSMGLAPLLVKEVFSKIQKLNEGGISVLLVEQNATAALKIAHNAYVIENGEIVMQGSADALLRDDRIQQAYLGM
jgi:branched-chain amino acid transport system ATP-binding protein